MISLIFLVLAFVLFLLGAFYNPPPGRPNLIALGLASYMLYILLGVAKI